MILKRIKQLINEFRSRTDNLKIQNDVIKLQNENLKLQNEFIKSQNAEIEWAHIFHDTIGNREWLKNLSISPGRWAGNYSFFYILVRVLTDCNPQNIIEFGLGESSKVISSFLANTLINSNHLIIEQDSNWINNFKTKFNLSKNSEILYLPLEIKTINGFPVNCYADIDKKVNRNYDLYVIDGPYGSDRFSRYDICIIAEKITNNDEFIIIIDDYNRKEEKETVSELLNLFKNKGIYVYTGIYSGNKSQMVIATEKHRHTTSL